MASKKTYDVWVQTGNTVYQGVPYDVVSRWGLEGRIGPTDKVRLNGTKDWQFFQENTDFQSGPTDREEVIEVDDEPLQEIQRTRDLEPIETPFPVRKNRDEEDEDVDMIPLIDISMVLLVFFMMTTTVSAISRVQVPEVKNGSKIEGDPSTLCIYIDRLDSGIVDYAVGIGKTPPAPDFEQLDEVAIVGKLDEVINQQTTPPRVRIAGHKQADFDRIERLLKHLETRKKAGQIISYAVEVGEKQ